MTIIVSLLVILTVYEIHAQCPDTFERHGNKCYKVLGLEANWINSKRYCRLIGSDLVRIDDAAEELLIDGVITRTHGSLADEVYWIDGADFLAENEFRWFYEDGHSEPIKGYFNWLPGQPDNAGHREHCMELQYNSGGSSIGWNDGLCNNLHSFICESTIDHLGSEIIG